MEAVKISECDFCWSRCRRYAERIRGFASFSFFSFFSFFLLDEESFPASLLERTDIRKALRYNSLFEAMFYIRVLQFLINDSPEFEYFLRAKTTSYQRETKRTIVFFFLFFFFL